VVLVVVLVIVLVLVILLVIIIVILLVLVLVVGKCTIVINLRIWATGWLKVYNCYQPWLRAVNRA